MPIAAPSTSQPSLQQEIAAIPIGAVAWIEAHWHQIAMAALAAAVVYLVLNLVRRWGIGLCRRGGRETTWYGILGRALARTSQIFIVLASVRLVLSYADAPPALAATIVTLFTVVAVFQGVVWLREIVFGAIELRTMEPSYNGQALTSALGIIRLLVTIALFAIAVVVVLSNLGVNVAGLVAGLGVGGIAIGLAAQGIFGDLFAALAILFDRPFRIGDTISYDKGSGAGTVEAIGLKSTRVRGAGGEERIIANRKLLDFEIINTAQRLHNRFRFDFLLGYATPPEVVAQLPALLREAVEAEGHKLIHGGLNGFAPDGLKYDVEFESIAADFPAEARDKVAAAILTRFRGQGIAFAHPAEVSGETSPGSTAEAKEGE